MRATRTSKKKTTCTVGAGRSSPKILLSKNQCSTLKPGKKLGCGKYGCAYVSNAHAGMVVKFTRDDEDAAGMLQTLGHPDVIPVDGVVELKTRFQDPIFAAVVKRASPLTKEEEFFIDYAFRPAAGRAMYAEVSREGKRPLIYPMAGGRQNIRKLCEIYGKKGLNKKKCLAVSLRIADIVENLAKKGLRLSDSHSGNFGKANGKIVVTDMGLTLAEFKNPPHILAGLFGWGKSR